MSKAETGSRTFTYSEAVELMPMVRRLTEQAYRRVESLAASGRAGTEIQAETDGVVEEWARALLEMGLEVKGLWLVDFDNGSGYYCWRYPEAGLDWFHAYEEGFQGRMRIQ
jgi:hypothetical protein